MTADRDDEQRLLRSSSQQLVQQFAGQLPSELVEQRFAEMVLRFDGARVRTFVPVLAAKAVRDELRATSGRS